MSAALSGRVSTLETQITNVLQELLIKIDIATHTTLHGTITTTVNAVQNITDNHETRIDNLEGLYSALAYNHNVHVANFTGHTGVTASGAHDGLGLQFSGGG